MVNLVDIINKLGSEGARWARRVKQEADYLSKLDHVSSFCTSPTQFSVYLWSRITNPGIVKHNVIKLVGHFYSNYTL